MGLTKEIDYSQLSPEAVSIIKLVPQISNIKTFYKIFRPLQNRKMFKGSKDVLVHNFKIIVNQEKVKCRIFYPPDTSGIKRGIIYFHGGGFVSGGLDTVDGTLREWCKDSKSVVFAVTYGLSPEFVYPSAVNECFAFTKFIFENAGIFNVDKNFITISGDSAGGNLALTTAIRMREETENKIKNLVLFYPFCECYKKDLEKVYPSLEKFKEGYLLTTEMLKHYSELYIGDGTETDDPMINPINAELEKLPRTLIILSAFDPLVDEGRELYKRMKNSNVDVSLYEFPNLIHGFFTLIKNEAKKAIQLINEFLK